MSIHKNYSPIEITMRCIAAILFASAALIATDCEAQLFRGRFARSHRAQPTKQAQQPNWAQPRSRSETSEVSQARFQRTMPRYFDSRNNLDPGSGNPRYIGGFHYTHFQNIGIPSGDIGLRGNAYHWRPW